MPHDVAFYFMHWLTDLAGAEATPLGGAEKFVLKFPHAVLSSFMWSIPYLQKLADESETAVMETYLKARWSTIAKEEPIPDGPESIACMRLAVMAQGDNSVVSAFLEQNTPDQIVLTRELVRTGSHDQGFTGLSSAVPSGGP